MPPDHAELDTLLREVSTPTSIEDVTLQMEMLADEADVEVAHKDADSLLIKALYMISLDATNVSSMEIDALVTAYKNIPKGYFP